VQWADLEPGTPCPQRGGQRPPPALPGALSGDHGGLCERGAWHRWRGTLQATQRLSVPQRERWKLEGPPQQATSSSTPVSCVASPSTRPHRPTCHSCPRAFAPAALAMDTEPSTPLCVSVVFLRWGLTVEPSANLLPQPPECWDYRRDHHSPLRVGGRTRFPYSSVFC
jgi:hypothetical protein